MARSSRSRPQSPWAKREERDRHRELKREAVLRKSLELFNEKGFHATSLDEVADALYVTKPTIYHYFGSKDEILFECCRRGVESIREAGAVVEKRGGSAMERLKAHMRNYAIVMTQDFGICVTRTADYELSKESRARFRALKRQTDEQIRSVIEEGMRDGSIAKGDSLLMTFALTGALNWIARWYDPKGPLIPDKIADGCVATLVEGLAPRSRRLRPRGGGAMTS
jgi:AcrR family transcriptional regulator